MSPHEILDTLKTVTDPEIPTLNIVDLGMVVSASGDPDIVIVLRPTYLGCPALDWIAQAVRKALEPLECQVSFDRTQIWSSTDMTEPGRARLSQFGIAPPPDDANMVPCPLCGSNNTHQSSPFGSTLCRSSYYCQDCRQPFETWKRI